MDGSALIFCGESYSYNFVEKPIQGFMMNIRGLAGTPKWGRFYQDVTTSSYIGIFNICKVTPNQRQILVAGGLNFYMPFVGFFDIETGEPQKLFRIKSNERTYSSNGFTMNVLELDAQGNIIGGIQFGNNPFSVYKISPDGIKIWENQLGEGDYVDTSAGTPNSCYASDYPQYFFVGTSIKAGDGYSYAAVFAIGPSSGGVNWFKQNFSINRVSMMQCQSRQEGVVGCGAYAATAFLFGLEMNGQTKFNYMFTGNNPESCRGITQDGSKLYVLLDSQSSSYTFTGYTDAIIMQFEVDTGKLKNGKFLSLASTLNLGRGLAKITNGPLVFGGATKKAKGHNFQYEAAFIQKVDFSNSKYSCQKLENVVDITAYGYKENQGLFIDPFIASETRFEHVEIVPITNLNSYQLKSMYKAYQLCFNTSFNSIYEKVEGSMTMIVENKTSSFYQSFDRFGNLRNDTELFTLPYPKSLIYYLYEEVKLKKIDDEIFQRISQDQYTVTLIDGSPVPNFITFSSDTISIQTSDEDQIGNYTLLFKGCDGIKLGLLQYVVDVRNNSAPYLIFDEIGWSMYANQSKDIQLPLPQDNENNSPIIYSVLYSGGSTFPYFIKFDQNTKILKVSPLSDIESGYYEFDVVIKEQNAPSMTNQYKISVTIYPVNKNNAICTGGLCGMDGTSFPQRGQLTGELKNISDQALVFIKFNQEVKEPGHTYNILKDAKYVMVQVKGPKSPYTYTWNITKIGSDYITIQLEFQRPKEIAIWNEKERINVTFHKNLFKAKKDPSNYLFNLEYEGEFKVMLDLNDPNLQALNDVSGAITAIFGVIMGSSFILQGLLGNLMSSLWAILNSLQILTYFSLLDINIPSHLEVFFKMLYVSHFDFIGFKDFLAKRIAKRTDIEPYKRNYETFGFSSSLSLVNYGDLWLAVIFFIGSYIIYRSILFVLIKFKKVQSQNKVPGLIYLQCLKAFMVLYPAWIYIFTIKNKSKFGDELFQEKFRTLWINFKSDFFFPRNYHFFFCVRRIYYSALLVFPGTIRTYQLSLNLVHCVAQVVYLVVSKPFLERKMNMTDIFNEVVILIVACLLFIFTDLCQSPSIKDKTGWAIILIVLTNVITNLIVLITEYVICIYKKIKEWRQRRSASKYEIKDKFNSSLAMNSQQDLFTKTDHTMTDMNASKTADDLMVEDIVSQKNAEQSSKRKQIIQQLRSKKKFKTARIVEQHRDSNDPFEEIKESMNEDDLEQYNSEVPQHQLSVTDPQSENNKRGSGDGSGGSGGQEDGILVNEKKTVKISKTKKIDYSKQQTKKVRQTKRALYKPKKKTPTASEQTNIPDSLEKTQKPNLQIEDELHQTQSDKNGETQDNEQKEELEKEKW